MPKPAYFFQGEHNQIGSTTDKGEELWAVQHLWDTRHAQALQVGNLNTICRQNIDIDKKKYCSVLMLLV